jgi:signal transduction histidine kinase
VKKNRTIKYDFLYIVFFSSFIPFIISLSFLIIVLKDSHEKIKLAHSQFQHTQELDILDSLHKSMNVIYKAVQSPEMNSYFHANMDTEDNAKNVLAKYLQSLFFYLPIKNASWVLFGSRANPLFVVSNEQNSIKLNRDNVILTQMLKGATFLQKNNLILLSIPLYYNSSDYSDKNIYAYISLLIPLSAVQQKYPYLKKIKYLPQDLSALAFKTEVLFPDKDNTILIILFFYIIIFVIFNVFAVFYGIKVFQNKIIDKLNLLALRVLNDVNQTSELGLEVKKQNEIDSLSDIFNKYFNYIQFLQYEIKKSSQLAAVGNIAHTLAHDLRKPFSNTNLFIEQIQNLNSLLELNKIVSEFKPSFVQSISYVEHILSEIMDAGISKLHSLEEHKLEHVLKRSFLTIINFPKGTDIKLEFNFACNKLLKIDEMRILRVFINLIGNAFEAMNYKGRLWIHFHELNNEFAQIIVGNDNSYIEPENISKLFEPFYTKNKKNGTGLGLSIVQQIVKLHGGSISCESDKAKGVEFIFTLPLSSTHYTPDLNLLPRILNKPTNYGDFNSRQDSLQSKNFDSQNETIANAQNFSSILNIENKELINNYNNEKLEVNKSTLFVLDDDIFIVRSWNRYVKDAQVISFDMPEEFLEYITKVEIPKNSVVVSDFNFGSNCKLSFYDFIKSLRKFYAGFIYVSSDANLEDFDLNFFQNYNIEIIKKKPYSFKELFTKNREKVTNSERNNC